MNALKKLFLSMLSDAFDGAVLAACITVIFNLPFTWIHILAGWALIITIQRIKNVY